jgi:predicted Zn-dependent protease
VIAFSNWGIGGVLLVAMVTLAACTTAPYTRTPPPVIEQGIPAPPRPPTTGEEVPPARAYPAAPVTRQQPAAVVALLDHAEQQANAGDLRSAAVTLERAIRIDSRNPVLWHHLASVRLAEGDALQAEQLAAKSSSLAPGNYALQARNWELIAEARRKRGDAAGAVSAERERQALQRR